MDQSWTLKVGPTWGHLRLHDLGECFAGYMLGRCGFCRESPETSLTSTVDAELKPRHLSATTPDVCISLAVSGIDTGCEG